jgi:hypothetical protein
MYPQVANVGFGLIKPQPILTVEQERFLRVLQDVGGPGDSDADRNPIRDLCEVRYAAWTSSKAEFEKRETQRSRNWPRYRAPDELAQSLRRILESWAVRNRLTLDHAPADWVVAWAIDVFNRWDSEPENGELFLPPERRCLPELTLSMPADLPEYLMIPMQCPRRKIGERHREFSRRVNKAVSKCLTSLKKPSQMPDSMPVPPRKVSLPRAAGSRQYFDHVSLALRICGVPLKQIKWVIEKMWPRTRSLATISRGAARAAKRLQLDLPELKQSFCTKEPPYGPFFDRP